MSKRRPETARIARLRLIMRERGIEALLVTQRENVRYLTGFTGSAGSLLLAKGRPVLITDFRYQVQAGAESPGTRLVIQKKDQASTIKAAAEAQGVATLWFDESSLTLDRVRALKKKGLRLHGAKDPVADIRQQKDSAELRHMKLAIRRAEDSFRELAPRIRAGATERELGLQLEMFMRERGARRAAFDVIVASGRNGAMPHASVTNKRLRNNDLVTIDFGAEANGYFCDITRTVCVGRPSLRQCEIHDLVRRAQQKAIEAVGPGVRCADVDRAAREIIKTAGHGAHFGHATGHGIGLMVHEAPGVSAVSKQRLETGMVITVEPGVYMPGWGGVRIEDMVLVTDDGYQVLTGLPRVL